MRLNLASHGLYASSLGFFAPLFIRDSQVPRDELKRQSSNNILKYIPLPQQEEPPKFSMP